MADKRLTSKERGSFANDKLTELDRMSDARMDAMLNPAEGTDEEKAAGRAYIIQSLAQRPAAQLRIVVNVSDYGSPPSFSADSDLSKAEENALTWGWRENRGNKPIEAMAAILAHEAEMVADGLSDVQRKHHHKTRGGN